MSRYPLPTRPSPKARKINSNKKNNRKKQVNIHPTVYIIIFSLKISHNGTYPSIIRPAAWFSYI